MNDHEDAKFVCGVCDKSYSGDISNVMTECRVCHRLHCNDCVDEYGRCVKCAEEESSKKRKPDGLKT